MPAYCWRICLNPITQQDGAGGAQPNYQARLTHISA
jgi:hypothetical protein